MKYSLFLFCTCFLIFACRDEKPVLLCEIAKHSNIPIGAPQYSDVCLSSRWERPRDESDTLDTFRALKQFHATRLSWIYTTNAEFLKKVSDLGYKVQVTMTPTLVDLPFGSGERKLGRVTKKDGSRATAPWMLSWEGWWGCVNHPEFQKIYWEHLKVALDAGVTDFQVDDPAMASVLVRNEWEDVCHCDYCKEKASNLGKSVGEIQEASTLEFHTIMKQKAEKHAGRPVPFSCNNFRGDWELFPHDFFDYGIAEAPVRRGNPEYIYAALRETRKRGKAQVFSYVSDRTWMIQKVLASTYASGGNLLVPWDVWRGGGKPRYFGKTKDFANYFGFVHAVSEWLEGYEDAYYTSTQIDERFLDRSSIPIYFSAYRRNMHAYIRAKPNEHNSPVVIHLVDWEIPNVDACEINLNEKFFFENGIGSLSLIQPVEFEPSTHLTALESNDYTGYKNESELIFSLSNETVTVIIPKLEFHWGLLIVYPKK